jgi:thimet oligopeptidase
MVRLVLHDLSNTCRKFWLISLLCVGCSGGAGYETPLRPMSNLPAAPAPAKKRMASVKPVEPSPLDLDPVPLGLTADGIRQVCDGGLARAELLLNEIRGLDPAQADQLTWEATLGKLDDAFLAMNNAGEFPQLMVVAHPEESVREAAKGCEPKVEKFETALYLDAKLAAVVRAFAKTKEAAALKPAQKRFLEHTLRDFRRNGLELKPDDQQKLTALNEKLTRLSQKFESNIASSTLSIEVEPSSLEGLSAAYKASHPVGKNGKVKLTTNYPDYYPFVQFSKDRKAALELTKKFDNRAAPENIKLLAEILKLRRAKALLLGYPTWADFVLEVRMAKNAKAVREFLEKIRDHLKQSGASEMRQLRAMHAKLGGKRTDDIPPSDRTYLQELVQKENYGLDSQALSEYFEVESVKQGILTITSKIYGITYRKADVPKWNDDVEPTEIVDTATGKVLGRFYFDLYPRPGKYKHAAVFGIRASKTMADGKRLMPIAAVVCNFPKPGVNPALLTHQEVTTFFHEFGHVLHQLLTQSPLAAFSGTAVARDFVESPSQMFEEWAWAKETLALFAKHYKTKAPLPAKLFRSLERSRSFGRALSTQRQLYLAALDQTLHSRDPEGLDSTKVVEEIHNSYTPFKFIPSTHFQAGFGHLIGYGVGYYGYQWALAISRDLLTRFKKEGLLNTKTAAAYRKAILEPGGSQDEAKMVEAFLGRAYSRRAFERYLDGN